eukprot:Opistho-1_new@101805
MAPAKNSAVIYTADYPLYAVTALGNRTVMIGGGGGRSKTGVPNVIEVLRGPFAGIGTDEVTATEAVEVACRQDVGERAVMSVCAHPRRDHIACGEDEMCTLYHVDFGKKTATVKSLASKRTDFKEDGGFQKCTRYDANGKRIVAGSTDGKLRVLEHPSLKELVAIDAHKEDVNDADFHPDGTHIASIGFDKKLHVWDAKTGERKHTIDYSKAFANASQYKLQCCRYVSVPQPDGKRETLLFSVHCHVKHPTYVACWAPDREYALVRTGVLERGPVTAMAVNDRGDAMAFGTAEGAISFFTTRGLKRMGHAQAHDLFVTAIAFDVAGTAVFSVSADGTCCKSWPKSSGPISLHMLLALLVLLFAIVFGLFLRSE